MVSIEEGQPAPDFTAEDADGRTWSLDKLEGQRVVLYFYPRDDTPGCTKEACSFRDNLEAFEEQGIQVLGVSDDDAKSHRAFAEKHELNFPLLVNGQEIAEAYGVWKKKQMFGNEFWGVQRATFLIGEDGTVEKVWPKVDPKRHAQEVLKALKTE